MLLTLAIAYGINEFLKRLVRAHTRYGTGSLGHRVNWVSGSLDSQVTGSLGHKMWPSSMSGAYCWVFVFWSQSASQPIITLLRSVRTSSASNWQVPVVTARWLVRSAVHSSAASDDHPGRPAVSQRAQDVQQYTTVSACLYAHQRLVHWRWIRPSRNAQFVFTSYGPVSVCVCWSQVGVLSKWLNESGWFFWRENYPTLRYKELQVPSKIMVFPSFPAETLLQTLDLEISP